MESLSTSSVSSVLSQIADVAGQFGVPGAGLFARVLKSGQTPIERVVEQVENGAYVEIARIRKHHEEQDVRLGEHDMRLKEFEARLLSQGAKSAYLGAVLNGLRSSDPKKHFRLGGLTVNCVYANELTPESLDEMMRAAVELNEADVLFLANIYNAQNMLLRDSELADEKRLEKLIGQWPNEQPTPFGRATIISRNRGAVARLQAHAFVQFRTPGAGAGGELVFLLRDGATFHERLRGFRSAG
jgi:hypothetical protein